MKCTECKVGYCAYRSTDPQRECPIQNGHRYSSHFSMPPQESGKGFIVPEGTRMVIDWSSFRREAAKEILVGLCANNNIGYYGNSNADLATSAITLADELIKQLKEE